jgi:hypothetical protein
MVHGHERHLLGGRADQLAFPTRKQAPGDLFVSLHTQPYREDATMTTTFSLSFAALSIDCADATVPASGPRLLFHEVPEPETVKNRLTVRSGSSYLQGGS